MTNQELYTTVRNHLLKQNQKATSNDRCLYRTAEGLKCAIGVLIPDSLYSFALEGWSCDRPIVKEATGLTDDQLPLGHALQSVHDGRAVIDWTPALDNIAKEFDLQVEEVSK